MKVSLTKIEEHVLALRKIFIDITATIEIFWGEMTEHCQIAGWLPQDRAAVPLKKRAEGKRKL